MNIFRNSLLRALAALVVGALLIKYPDTTLSGLTIAIGILFLVAGIISLVSWLYERRKTPVFTAYDAGTGETTIIDSRTMFPLVGLGSLVLGAILALMPETFVRLQMYVVAALLILCSLNLYMNLVATRSYGHVSFGYWLLPTATLLAGIFVLVKPMESAAVPIIILGWSLLLMGVTEFILALLFYSAKRAFDRRADEKVVVSADKTDDTGEAEVVADESDATPQTPVTMPSI